MDPEMGKIETNFSAAGLLLFVVDTAVHGDNGKNSACARRDGGFGVKFRLLSIFVFVSVLVFLFVLFQLPLLFLPATEEQVPRSPR